MPNPTSLAPPTDPAPSTPPELLTVKEASEYLRIPLPTVYYLVQRGQLPAIQIGGRWRLKRSLLDRDILKNEEGGSNPKIVALHDDNQEMGRELNPRNSHCSRIITTTVADACDTIFHHGADILLLGDCAALHELTADELLPLFDDLSDSCSVIVLLTSYINAPELLQATKRAITFLPSPINYQDLRETIARLVA